MRRGPLQRAAAWSAIGALALTPAAWGAPEGERVRRGRADFERTGTHTEITTHTRRTVIEYQSFDIAPEESVHIEQPTERSRVLNRVLSSDVTAIEGSLTSNGRIWIANPAGIFFGDRSIVDVGSLVAGAGAISNRDFRRERLRDTQLTGSVHVAEGARLQARESLLLAGRQVENYGHVDVPGGMIALLAADRVQLWRPGGAVRLIADAPPSDGAGPALVQAGELDADGGAVHLVAGDAWSLAMNRTGITRAADIHVEAGSAEVAGELDASSTGGSGGRIRVLGDSVSLDEARLDASGRSGGGEILVGGDFQGGGDTRTAVFSFVGPDAQLLADALESGDGGRIIVWSDDTSGFFGSLSARGGADGGDGGFAEISGRRSLVSRGEVDLSAPAGRVGTLLYDPLHIVILGGTADGTDRRDEADLLRGRGGNRVRIRFGDEGEGDGTTPFEIYESELETTDANIVLQAERSITTQGTFDGNDVVLQPERSLTLEVRDDGEELTEFAGIDIRSSDGGDLTWRLSEGGSLTLSSVGSAQRDGGAGIAVGDVVANTSPAGTPSLVSIRVEGRGDVEVGSIDVSGENAMNGVDAAGIGGAGGAVVIEVARGSLTLGSIDASGGDGTLNTDDQAPDGVVGFGGSGGAISLIANPYVADEDAGEVPVPAGVTPTLLVTGELTARGGVGNDIDPEDASIGTPGGFGGRVLVSAGLATESEQDGGIELQGDVDVSGGAGTAGGGDATVGGVSAASGAATGSFRAEARRAISLLGSLTARGGDSDPAGAGGFGGSGGIASLDSLEGAVSAASPIDLGGGAGFAPEPEIEADGDVFFPGQGGSAGALTAASEGTGVGVELLGPVTARGGDGQQGAGGAGGGLNVSAADGSIVLPDVDLSGGAGNGFVAEADGAGADTGASGGNGGNLVALAGFAEDAQEGDIELRGDIVSLGGAGVDPDPPLGDEDVRENHGVGGLARFEAELDVTGTGSELIRGGQIELVARDLTGFVLAASGDASPESFEDTASIAASGTAAVDLDTNAAGGDTRFAFVEAAARGAAASLSVTSDAGAGSVRIEGSGAGEVHTVTALESAAGDPHLTYRLLGPPDEETDQIDLRTLEAVDGAVDLGTSGGALANARRDESRPGGERLLGAVVGAPAGATLSSQGPLDLVGTSVSDLNAVGSGGEAELLLRVGGEVAGVTASGIAGLAIEQRQASADADVDLGAGDRVEIRGEVFDDGASRIAASRVMFVDTSASGTDFTYNLVDTAASSNDLSRGEPVLTLDGAIALGGDGSFAGTGDLVLLTPIDAGAGVVALIADGNGDGEGDLVPLGDGRIDVDGATGLRLRSAGSVGDTGQPLRTSTATELQLAALLGGDLFLENASGDLSVASVEVEALELDEESSGPVLFAGGALELENGGRAIRLGPQAEGVTGSHVLTGDGQRYGGMILLANPTEVETTDPDTGDPVTEMRNEGRLVAGGDVIFDGAIDTDPALISPDRLDALDVVTPDLVIFRGDIGQDVAGEPSLDSLSVDAARFEGARAVTVGDGDFRGSVDADASLVLRALGEDSRLRFGGAIGGDSDPAAFVLFDADADRLELDGRRLSAGSVRLNAETPAAEIPELASVTASRALRIESEGDVELGTHEKLSVAGTLHIRAGGDVAVGDLNASVIDIDAARIEVLGRQRGVVRLADGQPRIDSGTDWAANSIRTSVTPEWDGVGLEPRLALGDGELAVAGGSPFAVFYLDDEAGGVNAARLAGVDGMLDLFAGGPAVVGDPSDSQPQPETLAAAPVEARASGVDPVPPPLPDAEQVLGFVRCAGKTGSCDPARFGAAPDSALASERAREIVRRYHEILDTRRSHIELASAFAPLAGAAAPRRALRSARELAAARRRLDDLAVVLAQVSLLGLPEDAAQRVRRAVAGDFARATGVAALDTDTVLAAVAERGTVALP